MPNGNGTVSERYVYAPLDGVRISAPEGSHIECGVGDRRPAPICPGCKGSLVEIAKIASWRDPLIVQQLTAGALHASPAMGPLEY